MTDNCLYKNVNNLCVKYNSLSNKLDQLLSLINKDTSLVPTLLDAFGRQKVSNPTTLFDAKFITSIRPFEWDTLTDGSGSIVFNPANPGFINMNVSSNGDKVVRQSRLYTSYQPGKSLEILITGTLNTSSSNF